MSLKSYLEKNGFIVLIVILAGAYGIFSVSKYLNKKANYGFERYDNAKINPVYKNNNNNSNNSNNASANMGLTSQSANQNPNDLLPSQTTQWSNLNPNGKGELANINLLKAGYHMGIDTVGQTLRNANLQIRSEPPNPQSNVGPWNNTTITPNPFQVAFEIGGQQ